VLHSGNSNPRDAVRFQDKNHGHNLSEPCLGLPRKRKSQNSTQETELEAFTEAEPDYDSDSSVEYLVKRKPREKKEPKQKKQKIIYISDIDTEVKKNCLKSRNVATLGF
jgi:hypothetical protein